MNLNAAFSPCPNDTFAFDAWVHNKIAAPFTLKPVLLDIWQLNQHALMGSYPITKVSAYCLGKITKDYVMLPTGCATGFDNGPKLVAKKPYSTGELQNLVVAVPGEHTTAHLLLELLVGKPKKILFLAYHQIVPALLAGVCDAGVIIHETRFTYQQHGLVQLADLGALFAQEFKLPIPLGMVVIKRDLGKTIYNQATKALQASIAYAKMNPKSSLEYVQSASQEIDPTVIQKHIDLYVNAETYEISQDSLQAIKTLFEAAIERKLLTRTALDFILN